MPIPYTIKQGKVPSNLGMSLGEQGKRGGGFYGPLSEGRDQSPLLFPRPGKGRGGERLERHRLRLTALDDHVDQIGRQVGKGKEPAGVPMTKPFEPSQFTGGRDLTGFQATAPFARNRDGPN